MPEIVNAYADLQIQLFFDQLINSEIQLSRDLLTEIKTFKASGISDDEIVKTLKDRFFGQTNSITALMNKQGAEIWAVMKRITQNTYFSTFQKGMYRWQTNPTAQHCSECMARDGRIDTFDNWVIRGLPGTGNTTCRQNCMCDLVPEK